MKIKMYWGASGQQPEQDEPLEEYKRIYEDNIANLKPDKKSAWDVLRYVRGKYPTEEEPLERLCMVVELNALNRRPYLPEGVLDKPPEVIVLHVKNAGAARALYDRQEEDYWYLDEDPVQDIARIPQDELPAPIYVGLETRSGYVYVEGSPSLANELFVYQGLNEKELQNEYLVARYVKLLKKTVKMKGNI